MPTNPTRCQEASWSSLHGQLTRTQCPNSAVYQIDGDTGPHFLCLDHWSLLRTAGEFPNAIFLGQMPTDPTRCQMWKYFRNLPPCLCTNPAEYRITLKDSADETTTFLACRPCRERRLPAIAVLKGYEILDEAPLAPALTSPTQTIDRPTLPPWETTAGGRCIMAGDELVALVADGPRRQANANLLVQAPSLAAENEELHAALAAAAEEIAYLQTDPLVWTLQVDADYLSARLTFEDARAWSLVLGHGRFAEQNPEARVAVVTA